MQMNASTFPFTSTVNFFRRPSTSACLNSLKRGQDSRSWEALALLLAGWGMGAGGRHVALTKARLVLDMTLPFLILYLYELASEHHSKHFITDHSVQMNLCKDS